jgi:hypothetical protein
MEIDKFDDPNDVLDALVLMTFMVGTMPWARWVRLHRVRDDATLLPAGAAKTRVSVGPDVRAYVAEGDGWLVHVTRWDDGTADLTIVARDEDTGQAIFGEVTHEATAPETDEDADVVNVGFWHLGSHGGQRRVRSIAAEPWPAIRHNYPRRVGAAFDRLMAIEPDQVNGRLLLLHGPPGTGKTTVLRALARAWQKWCRLDCVLDPERLLGESSYLMAAALGHDDDQTDRWRLLLLEDCDELIRADAKRGSGQSLSRLLNLTDGMLGQGLEVIVGITTNEPLTKLHPAIVRPGRCLAHIEVGRFNRLEAIDWLGRPATIGTEGVTLAELFTLRGELTTVETKAPAERVGLYL